MSEHLFFLTPKPGLSLQTQIKSMLVSSILDGHLLPGESLPSGRRMSQLLNVSRNTVVLVYEKLVEEGYLISEERRGYFVNPHIHEGALDVELSQAAQEKSGAHDLRWAKRFKIHPGSQTNLRKPEQWRQCQYPFIFGQLDPELFPVADWRDCTRQATSSLLTREWLGDNVDIDDPMLIEQLRSRVLPRRGIRCRQEEILVTLGTQHSLYLLAQLLTAKGSVLGIENPGYVDVRNIFALTGCRVKPLEIDDDGLKIIHELNECDYLYVTPSHQSPTTVTMSLARRKLLLEKAQQNDQIIIEDDYESEISFSNQPLPALKSLDENSRVIYVGSLSKTLSPGLRMGYLVGPAELIREARALRRLMLRHPPTNNQRTLALFLSGGFHDTFIRRLASVYRERHDRLTQALARCCPQFSVSKTTGGSCVWLSGPDDFSASLLQKKALQESVFIEPGLPFFLHENARAETPDHFMRLGYSAIATDKIEEGIKCLANVIASMN